MTETKGGDVMPRPQRCRKICEEPVFKEFTPDNGAANDAVVLTFDEFEVIRLVDLEKQTHEQCAKQMEISRTTVTEIYESARRKIADCIVNGHPLTISGGNYKLCNGTSTWCYQEHCKKQDRREENTRTMSKKGEHIMRIAVTYEDGMIFQHFGHSEQFKIYDVEDGKVTASQVVDTNGSGHGALAGFLSANEVEVLICGGIGGGAQMALAEAGIKLYGGVSGSADEAVAALLAGSLGYNPNVRCNHHDHEHGEGGHTCGSHGCGSHSCH